MDDHITKVKRAHRKKRYTFPDELDEYKIHPIKQKRRHSIHVATDDDFDNYNEKHVIIKKNADGIKKEIIIRNYTKVHPVVEDDGSNGDDPPDEEPDDVKKAMNILYKFAVKILCYLGMLSCIAI